MHSLDIDKNTFYLTPENVEVGFNLLLQHLYMYIYIVKMPQNIHVALKTHIHTTYIHTYIHTYRQTERQTDTHTHTNTDEQQNKNNTEDINKLTLTQSQRKLKFLLPNRIGPPCPQVVVQQTSVAIYPGESKVIKVFHFRDFNWPTFRRSFHEYCSVHRPNAEEFAVFTFFVCPIDDSATIRSQVFIKKDLP